MRIMVFFDLPTLTKTNRKNAAKFRAELLKDGYYMLQWSVYSRICKGAADAQKHSQRLRVFLPPTGSVRVLIITEKQFASIEILVGERKNEEKIGSKQLLFF